MTHDEIMALDAAGLDTAIDKAKGVTHGEEIGTLLGFPVAYIPQKWSSDIRAAWELVEEVHAADCGIEIHDVRHRVGNKIWWDYEGTLYCPVGFGAEECTITGNTPEELISRAYLMFDEWRKIS